MKLKCRFIFTALITLILCFSLSGCKEYTWQFEQGIENIEKIEIVDFVDTNFGLEVDCDFVISNVIVIKEINKAKYSDIIANIQELSMAFYFGDPMYISHLGIKITFKNGDFDFITVWEPAHFYKRESKYIINYNRWMIKNKSLDRFEEIIAKWSE